MKFCDLSFLKRWLLSVRSFWALALLTLVILLMGILCANAGEDDTAVQTEQLDIRIEDAAGVKRLFQEGTAIRLSEVLYFLFPKESCHRQIRIDDGDWQTVDGECYRLDWKALCTEQRNTLRISFRAHAGQGQCLERSFFFITVVPKTEPGTEDAIAFDTPNMK
ncbi:MAG: hypothetical protein ACI4SE_03590 [Lachnospiraceae bacterium]